MAAFLDQTSAFSFEALSAACRKLGRTSGAFPPSAGDLYSACVEAQRRVDSSEVRALDLSKYQLPPPARLGYTPEQLADWTLLINGSGPYVMRVDAKGTPLRIPAGYPGAGKTAVYGYLTPAESRALTEAPAPARRDHFREAAE